MRLMTSRILYFWGILTLGADFFATFVRQTARPVYFCLKASVLQIVCDLLIDLKCAGIVAQFFIARCHGIRGIAPFGFHFKRSFPMCECFVIPLHGTQQIAGIDMQQCVLREFACSFFRPLQGGTMVFFKRICLYQTDPILQFAAFCFNKREKLVDVFLVSSDSHRKYAF